MNTKTEAAPKKKKEDASKCAPVADAFTVFREKIALGERSASSCRFAPYYKAQWYDEKNAAWRDISARFKTQKEAAEQFNTSRKWRVMEVAMGGRKVI